MNQSELEGESTKEAVYPAHFILLFHFIVQLCKNTVFIKIFPYQGRIYTSYVVSRNAVYIHPMLCHATTEDLK